MSRMKAYTPYTVIQTARNPLPDQIAGLFGFYKVLVAVHVRDVPESLSFNLTMSAKGTQSVWCYTHSSISDGICAG